MTLDELQGLLADQAAFRREIRKDTTVALLKGNFREGRVPYVHQVTFPNGSQLRFKFYDTVKVILNSKGQPVYGKESSLSYVEVAVAPIGQKAYSFSLDVNQIVWGVAKSKALIKHAEALSALRAYAETLGIDLSSPTSWATVYTENY
jgi:hypothetical protein